MAVIAAGLVLLLSSAGICLAKSTYAPPKAGETSLQVLNEAARQAYSDGNYPVAERNYLEALKINNNNARAKIILWSNLGAVYREQRNFPKAEQAFKQALAVASSTHTESDPATVLVQRQYALLLRKQHKNEDAEAWESRATALESAGSNSLAGRSTSATDTRSSNMSGFDSGHKLSSRGEGNTLEAGAYERAVQELLDAHKAHRWGDAVIATRGIMSRFPSQADSMHGILALALHNDGQMPAFEIEYSESQRHADVDPVAKQLIPLYTASRAESESTKAPVVQAYGHGSTSESVFNPETNSFSSPSADSLKIAPTREERRFVYPREKMPLKVYVHDRYNDIIKFAESKSMITENQPGPFVQKACDSWTQATGNMVSFELTDRLSDAQVVVDFTTNTNLGEGCALGITQHPGYGESVAYVTLLTTSRTTGSPVDRDTFYGTCLHEIGHALGLAHSPSPADIMFGVIHSPPLTDLSQRDSERMRALYSAQGR